MSSPNAPNGRGSSLDGTKTVIVVNDDLPAGLVANAAAVLALTLGRRIDGLIGPDLKDASGQVHAGITTVPLPVLRANDGVLRRIRDEAGGNGGALLIVDFTDAAQQTRTYDEYTRRLAGTAGDDLSYLGVALHGPAKVVNRFTGSLPLVR